jgi:hypothetical protein
MGSYWDYDHEYYAISPMHARVRFPQYAERWSRMSCFEKCLFRWLETTAYGEEVMSRLPYCPALVVKFEEMIKSDDILENIARFLGFESSGPLRRAHEDNALKRHNLERYPVGNEWERYRSYPEVLEYARKLGYNMDPDEVARLVSKYHLPPGVLPYLRHRTGFWRLRSRAGVAMRKLGLRREYPDKARMQRQLQGQIYPSDRDA